MNRSLKRHMVSGSRCPIDDICYCDVEVMGQRPRRGRWPMISHWAILCHLWLVVSVLRSGMAILRPERVVSGLGGLILRLGGLFWGLRELISGLRRLIWGLKGLIWGLRGLIWGLNQSPKGNMWSAIPFALLCMIVNLSKRKQGSGPGGADDLWFHIGQFRFSISHKGQFNFVFH